MDDSIKKIMSQIFEIDPQSIDSSSSPENVERWDSLKHMQLIMALEDEFGIQFPDEKIPDLVSYDAIRATIGELHGS